MNLLPSSTVRLIASSQVITSVSSAVKELIENSLDAGATSIEVKLDGWGLERIEVRDNGCGIKPEDAPFVGQPHYTSKISNDDDLKFLQTYGFRGEALGSLASVSNVSVLTKTESDEVGMLYTLQRDGKIEATQPKPTVTGTTVVASNLFKNLPVRKQFSSNNKKCKEELKRVEDLVIAYALVHPSLRISLRHNKTVIWQKSKVSNHKTALLSVFGTALLAQMGTIEFHDESQCNIRVLGYLPKPGSDSELTGRAVNDRCFVFFNGRPVNMKQISQVIKQYYNSHTTGTANRYPVAFLDITVPPDGLDVNLEPNKTSVLLTNKEEVMTLLTNLLEEFYSDEKNKISDRTLTGTCTSNGAEKGDCPSKNECGITENICNGNVSGIHVRSSGIANAVGECNVTEACRPAGKVANGTPCSLSMENNQHENSNHQSSLFERTAERNIEHSACKAAENTSCNVDFHPNNAAQSNITDSTSNSCLTSKSSHGNEKHTCNNNSGEVQKRVDQATPSTCHKDTCTNAGQLWGTISDKSLCAIIDLGLDVLNTSRNTTVGNGLVHEQYDSDKHDSSVGQTSSDDIQGIESSGRNMLINKDNSKAGICAEKMRDVEVSTCKPSLSRSVEDLFSDDFSDDLFDDLDLEVSGVNCNDRSSTLVRHVEPVEKSKDKDFPVSSSNKDSVSLEKSVAPGSSDTSDAKCSEKDWSMGHGIVDKQGKPVEPVCLITPGPLNKQPSAACNNKTPVTPLHGKRKQSSCQLRLSLSSKKIKKIPEITNQPLITKIMSPNPMQRKVLYKKENIPFCLATLKQSQDDRGKDQRYKSKQEETNSDHLIGRLDPWGVWLIKRGNDIVCVNQYR
ncbi:unnamed protein product [Porites evermanni]|uniref:DNA mismatch repair protein S5 domain-containing protein n=1 Tax=Porites evermanni TaxID=104178 RepID=A0ABN8QH76_9CNID|nr:unnamed protein product [Porites evermanni]